MVGRVPGLGGVYEDREDPNPRLQAWLSGWDHWRAEASEIVEVGDYVLVLASYSGTGKDSGVEIKQLGAHVFEVREGKVVRLEIFATRERALEWLRDAAGPEALSGSRRPPPLDRGARDPTDSLPTIAWPRALRWSRSLA